MLRIHMRQERGALIGWSVGLFLYFLMIGLSYATVKDNTEYDDLWQEMPEGMREAFGGTESITSVDGFVTGQATSYLPLLLGIYGVAAATKRTAGAEETGLLDHLLARPVSRGAYVGTLAAALAINITLILAVACTATLVGMAASGVGAGDLLRLVAMFADILPISLTFLGIGLLFGTVAHRRPPALGTGLAVALGAYALHILAQVVEGMSWLAWVNPFGLWARSDAFHGDVDGIYYAASIVLVSGTVALAIWRFGSKDLYA